MTDVSNCDRLAEGSATSPLELTILMPCLNEAETISICVAKAKSFLERAGIAGEVLIADNGSSDGSVALAQRDGARVIAVEERGYGAALRAGVAAARGGSSSWGMRTTAMISPVSIHSSPSCALGPIL